MNIQIDHGLGYLLILNYMVFGLLYYIKRYMFI